MENHVFLNAFINDSATVAEIAGADITQPAHKVVAYDKNGDVVLAGSGDKAVGVILSDTNDPVKAGQRVNVLIKEIGLAVTGGAIAKGDLVTVADGAVTAAAAGDFVFGRAFTAAADAGQLVQVQINPMGALAASAAADEN